MKKKKVIAIVAHDNRKKDMMEWVAWNWKELSPHSLICTGTTGKLVNAVLVEKCRENDVIPPNVERLKSGPLGGDQQLGALFCDLEYGGKNIQITRIVYFPTICELI
jgi:methylglyoxal synthase